MQSLSLCDIGKVTQRLLFALRTHFGGKFISLKHVALIPTAGVSVIMPGFSVSSPAWESFASTLLRLWCLFFAMKAYQSLGWVLGLIASIPSYDGLSGGDACSRCFWKHQKP